MILQKGDRVRALDYEFKGFKGTVYDVFDSAVVVVQFDKFPVKVATLVTNLERI